jgi:inosose dehydratase
MRETSAVTSKIHVGNAPVSWGVYEAEHRHVDWIEVLDAIAEAGYAGTELGPYGYMPTDPDVLRSELAKRGLALGSSYVPLPLSRPEDSERAVARGLEVARLLATQGVTQLICADEGDDGRKEVAGRVAPDGTDGLDDRRWTGAARTLETLARQLRDELGMSIVVHHHAGTYIETAEEIDRLLAMTDPELVGLLLDTGHALFGGAEPLDVLAQHGDRVRYIHFKDADTSVLARVRTGELSMDEAWKAGVFCPLGKGAIAFGEIVERLRAFSYRGWGIVEQDVVPAADGSLHPDPFEAARESRRYLRETAGI